MKVGDLVEYIGDLTSPYIFTSDPTLQPQGYGIVVEIIDQCEGMCYCVFWPEAHVEQWHDFTEIRIANEK